MIATLISVSWEKFHLFNMSVPYGKVHIWKNNDIDESDNLQKSMPKVTFFYKSKMNEKHEKKDLDCLRFNYKTNWWLAVSVRWIPGATI